MRKLFTSLFLMVALIANAQQLPNYGFNSWKASCGSTDGGGQRPGVEPSEWNGSSVNQMGQTKQLIFNDNGSVKMQNMWVGVNLGITKIGSVAPGYITLGTPWVYASTTLSDCDGGTSGGASFSYKPDAITGRFKRTDSNDENSYIVVYLWNGTFTSNIGKKSKPDQSKDNVDRAILGKTSTTSNGTLIAECNYAFKSTGGDWQTITAPINYKNNGTPSMMNVVISGGDYWDRNALKENTTLFADDIKFVYYSELASVRYGGVEYYGNNGIYEIDAAYDPFKGLELTSNGRGATIEQNYDSSTKTMHVVVKGNDFASNSSNMHEYYINFAGGEDGPVVGPDENEPEELGDKLMSLDDADPSKAYVLYNEHFTAYAIFNPEESANKVWTAGMRGDADHPLKYASYGAKVDLTSPYSSWTVKKTGDKYSLCNVGSGLYLNIPARVGSPVPCTFSTEEVLLSVKDLNDGKFAFNAAGGDKDYLCAAPQFEESPLTTWESSDAGAAWQLKENPNVNPDEVTPAPPVEDEVDYTPKYTGVKNRTDRWLNKVTLNGNVQNNEIAVDNSAKSCYNDYTATDTMTVAAGKEVTMLVDKTGDWMNAYVYIDTDKNGFAAAIKEGSEWEPDGDLVSYSFYNNNAESADAGWNSAGEVIAKVADGHDPRSTVVLPSFKIAENPGFYRVRVKLDWCNIDPAGDADKKFDDFMENGGQILDFILQVYGVSLSQTSVVVTEGETFTLDAAVLPAGVTDAAIEWSTSDAAVATVDNGAITAVAPGTVVITAKAGELSAACTVTVEKKKVPVTDIDLSQIKGTLRKGETLELTAVIEPADATDKTVLWSTSDAAVATVDNGVVTAIAPGSAIITAKAGEYTATCVVTVLGVDVTSVELNLTEATLFEGGTVELVATIAPDDATDKSVTWTTSDAAVATVDANGLVTAVSVGTATVTATAGEVTAVCKVCVIAEPELPALELLEYTPSDTVASLSKIELLFNGVVELGEKAAAVELRQGIKVASALEIAAVDSLVVITLAEEIVETGNYILYIPEGAFKFNGAESAFNATLKFVVKGTVQEPEPDQPGVEPEPEPEPTPDPVVKPLELVEYTPADTVASLGVVELIFNQVVELGEKAGDVVLKQGEEVAAEVSLAVVDSVVTVTIAEELAVSGDYTLYIPAGAFNANGAASTFTATLNFIVKAAAVDEPGEPEAEALELLSYTPAGTVNSLKVIELVFNQPVEVGSKIKNVELRQGLKVASSIVEVNIVDSVVTIVLEKELTVSGEYVLCIPEKAFYARESEHTIATTLKFVVENEVLGIDEILANQDKMTIYDLTGRKLLEIGRPGIYIINGRKYLVRF